MINRWIAYSLLLLSYFPLQSGHLIKKRSIRQFGHMIDIAIGKKIATGFNGYGNYCGFGGSGVPVDNIDHCCMDHDKCYQYVQRLCFSFIPARAYILHYHWTYHNSDITCTNRNMCRQILCLCDKRAVHCFAKNLASYNPRHVPFLGKLFNKVLDRINIFK